MWGAVAPELIGVGGQYLNNCWLIYPSKKIEDAELGAKLWSLSVQMIEKAVGTKSNLNEHRNQEICLDVDEKSQ